MAKNTTTNQTAPAQSAPELENQETHTPRTLAAADFRPFFPESSGKCMILFGANSLSITEDKGFRPTMTIPYAEEWLAIVRQTLVVSISDSFEKPDNAAETFTATKKATVTVGYLLANALNGSMERGNTNFYAKQTGKSDAGVTQYGNRTEAGLERIANAMQALDLSPSTFGQEKKATFIFAKFVAWVDEQTKAGGTLNAKLDTWAATKKRYPTSRLLEAAVLKLMREHGPEYWLTAPILAAGYVEPAEIESESLADLL
ncbi:MAG: hypothetical protein WCT07_04600 [Candidatus Paceibacterota bacterium]|jgi:hypothetical protein